MLKLVWSHEPEAFKQLERLGAHGQVSFIQKEFHLCEE